METRTFSEKEVQQIRTRYHQRDAIAGQQVDALAKGLQRDTGMEYSEALHHILRPPPEKYSQRETDPDAIRNAGVELAKVAESIKRTGVVVFHSGNVDVGRVNDSEALRLAVISNPILGGEYTGHDVLPDAQAYAQVKRVYGSRALSRRYDAGDATLIANIISGLPKLADRSIDWAAAVRAVAPYAKVARQAATDEINHRANRKAQGNVSLDLARSEVRRESPALAAMANGGAVTQEGLRELLPQFAK